MDKFKIGKQVGENISRLRENNGEIGRWVPLHPFAPPLNLGKAGRSYIRHREGFMKKIDRIIKEFKEKNKKLYGNRLKGLVLYGSWARGEGTEHSDIDLAVILEGEVIPGKEIDKMIDIITEIGLKYKILISVYPVSENIFYTAKSPLLINIRKEGIPA